MTKGMAKTATFLWDAAEYLKIEQDLVAYLVAALEEQDTVLICGRAWRHRPSQRQYANSMRRRLGAREFVQSLLAYMQP